MLLLIDDPKKNCALIEFINSMKKSGIYLVLKSTLQYKIRLYIFFNIFTFILGLYVVGHVHIGDFEQVEGKDPSVTELPHWQSLIDHLKVKGGDYFKDYFEISSICLLKFNIYI